MKYLLLLPVLLLALSCEKMDLPENGFYLNGEQISRIEDDVHGSGNLFGLLGYSFAFSDPAADLHVSLNATSTRVWETGDYEFVIRSIQENGRGLMLARKDGKETARYYELESGTILEEPTVTSRSSGLLDVSGGTTLDDTVVAKVDISFALSNGNAYRIVYYGSFPPRFIYYEDN